jgi:hypothetical protein
VEPMSGETDAYNNHEGLIVLEPAQSWQGTFSLGVEPRALQYSCSNPPLSVHFHGGALVCQAFPSVAVHFD